MKELLSSKFLSFFTPYISYIDSGKLFRAPFSWVCILLAVVNAIVPFYVLYQVIDSGLFEYAPTKFLFAFIFIFIVLLFGAWFSIQYWLDRSVKMNQLTSNDAEFVATPVFSNLIQSLGEWAGSYVAIVGFCSTLIVLLFASDGLGRMMPMGDIMGNGLLSLIQAPLCGFMIIVISRVFAEVLRALTSIANNTAKK